MSGSKSLLVSVMQIQAYVVANPLLVALATVVINITPANLNFPTFAQNAYVAFISDCAYK